MNCNCKNGLSEGNPEGIRAIWEEYKIPISISGAVIGGVVLYSKFGNKKQK